MSFIYGLWSLSGCLCGVIYLLRDRPLLSYLQIIAMLPTPELSHISEETYQQVYEPAGQSSSPKLRIEDTFILLDALERDIPFLRQLCSRKSLHDIPLVIEIGCAFRSIVLMASSGSGCVSAFLQKHIFLPHECCIQTLFRRID